MTDQQPAEGNKDTPPTNTPEISIEDREKERRQEFVNSDNPKKDSSESAAHKNYNPYKWMIKKLKKANGAEKIALAGIAVNSALVLFTGIYIFITGRIMMDNESQFTTINMPNLSLGAVGGPARLDSSQHCIGLPFNIYNIGNHVTHIYYSRDSFEFDAINVDTILKNMKAFEPTINSVFVSVDHPIDLSINIAQKISPHQMDMLKKGLTTFYGDYVYFNDIDRKWRSYKFVVRYQYRGQTVNGITDFIYNENKDTTLSYPVPN